MDTRNLRQIYKHISSIKDLSLKDLEYAYGTTDDQDLARVVKLEQRIQDTLTNNVTNGGTDTKMNSQ